MSQNEGTSLETTISRIVAHLEAKNASREQALSESRQVIRHAANAIRAIHRKEFEQAQKLLEQGRERLATIKQVLASYQDLYWAGYVQDAQKEYTEARLTYALVQNETLPAPEDLGVEDAPYLNGLAEAASELRRYILDMLRHGKESSARLQGKRVLEIGCGTGSLLKVLLERNYKAYGLDASPAMLKQARKKLELAGFKGRLVQAKVQHLPFPDNSFETVVSTFPTGYIMSLESLTEIQRVLYPGGRLVIVDTAILKPYNRASRFLIRLYGLLGVWGGRGNSRQKAGAFNLPLAEAGLVRRDETAEDDQGEAHIIIALKVW